jgi:nucleotide-binding universal stress UspA family protein
MRADDHLDLLHRISSRPSEWRRAILFKDRASRNSMILSARASSSCAPAAPSTKSLPQAPPTHHRRRPPHPLHLAIRRAHDIREQPGHRVPDIAWHQRVATLSGARSDRHFDCTRERASKAHLHCRGGAMAAFQHILVPVDLSDRSRGSVAEALALARGAGARLSLLHVAGSHVAAAERADLRQRVSALIGPRDERLDLHVDVIAGDPTRELLEFAAAGDVDLMIVGARRRGTVERALLESVGDTIAREAPCSVLAVGAAADGVSTGSGSGIRRILCAVDLAEGSRYTTEVAGAVADALGAHLTVLHVIDPWHWPDPAPASIPGADEVRATLQAAAERRLSPLICRYSGLGPGIDGRVVFGLVGPQILNVAGAVGADVIVLGAHSKRVFGRTYLGSTARYIGDAASGRVLFARPLPVERRPPTSVPSRVSRA